MDIIVFGATGRTGKELVKQALEQGHNVTAFVRDVLRSPFKHKNLQLYQGNVLNPAQVNLAVKGHEAVLSALGNSAGSKNKTICSEGAENIINAMERHRIKKFVVESAYGVYDTRQKFYSKTLWWVVKSNMQDKERMEMIVASSKIDWVIVRPVALTNKSKTGRYRAGENIKTGFWPTISRADTADFMLKALTDDTYLHKTPTITY